jgi:proline iminopeptidase
MRFPNEHPDVPRRLDSPYFALRLPVHALNVAVDDIHTLRVETCGNEDGTPILLIHGGPGGGMRAAHRDVVDLDRYWCISFDQRGCGGSTPTGDLRNNTTADLVEDIEVIRRILGIDRWMIVGGSWGSTLGLCYAEQHPSRVAALIVSGVTLGSPNDFWWWWEGSGFVYPEAHATLEGILSPDEREDVRASYVARILGDDTERAHQAALLLSQCESMLLTVEPEEPWLQDGPEEVERSINSMRIYAHYDRHDFFLSECQILNQAHTLRGIPGRIVSGRFDMCTPPSSAFRLAQVWSAPLEVVPLAGHRWSDYRIGRAITRAISDLS